MEKQIMAKTVGNVLGVSAPAKYQNTAGNNWVKYLNEYDTSNVDTTLNNLSSWASNASSNINNMGNYNFNVNASDAARQQAQDATYQAYVDKLTPQFDRQTSDMQARLANQGIRVNCILPGRVETPLINRDNISEEQVEKNKLLYPLKRYAKPEEIAYYAIYLLSDASSFTTLFIVPSE